jgi:hydroxyacyl-ACP dehydratase HTD2-like protein with hotdog domain
VRPRSDGGSTIPLILGFFLVGLLVVGGSVAAADAYVQQRGLQDVCDGAAAAAAASALRLNRDTELGAGERARLAEAAQAVAGYLAEDRSRSAVRASTGLSADARTVELTCTETSTIAFGAMFGKPHGVHHTVHSAARAPLAAATVPAPG